MASDDQQEAWKKDNLKEEGFQLSLLLVILVVSLCATVSEGKVPDIVIPVQSIFSTSKLS